MPRAATAPRGARPGLLQTPRIGHNYLFTRSGIAAEQGAAGRQNGQDALREELGGARGPAGARRPGAAVHRLTPGARGDLAASIRRPAPSRAESPPAGPD